MSVIRRFNDENRFLSNFEVCDIVYEGLNYNSVEAAYQASKTLNIEIRKKFCSMNAKDAKLEGRKIKVREDWEQVKLKIMYFLVAYKFYHNIFLKEKLLKTEDTHLIEGNWWGDKFWGVCNNEGENWLGRILMDVRKKLKERENGPK